VRCDGGVEFSGLFLLKGEPRGQKWAEIAKKSEIARFEREGHDVLREWSRIPGEWSDNPPGLSGNSAGFPDDSAGIAGQSARLVRGLRRIPQRFRKNDAPTPADCPSTRRDRQATPLEKPLHPLGLRSQSCELPGKAAHRSEQSRVLRDENNELPLDFDRRTCCPTKRDVPTFRRSDVPTFRRSDVPTFRRSDVPTFRRRARCHFIQNVERESHNKRTYIFGRQSVERLFVTKCAKRRGVRQPAAAFRSQPAGDESFGVAQEI
jgi:hypothetical protein